MILNHPHILECYGHTNIDGNVSIVLELAEYGSLDTVIYEFFEVDKFCIRNIAIMNNSSKISIHQT